ncbi:MAG: DUF4349 domain-containing protein [Armatimonadota bacterium]|nr:DUF4349 domain-containing protein [Armatimonadota bacterium]
MNDLKAFLDGELDAAAAATMQNRLTADATLNAAADAFRRVSASFLALTEGPAVTGRDKVMAVISGPARSSFPRRTAGAIASLMLVTVVAVILFPVFAQQKEAAKRTTDMAKEFAAGEAEAPAANAAVGGLDRTPKTEDLMDRPVEQQPRDRRPDAPAKSRVIGELFYDRQVIKTASLEVRVKSIDQAEAKVTSYVDSVRGYVENSSSSNLDGRSPSMTLSVRIPQQKFSEALASFEKLGERTAKDIQSSDVSQAVVDMDARLKNLRSQEETYRAILRTARKIGEIIDVQERLSVIRGEIESMQAQRDSMAKLAALSTITLTLSQRPPPEDVSSSGWVEDTWASSTHALAGALKGLSVIGIWILVYAPIWIPLSLVTIWGWRRALRA